jgi:hypothetical protein
MDIEYIHQIKLYLSHEPNTTVKCLLRKDLNANGGVVAMYVQSHIAVRLREDLMSDDEVIWIQVNLPHLKPILV